MASYIQTPGVVADFGCGMMWLEERLGPQNSYLPIDYIKRDDRTMVLDLNRDSLDAVKADVAFLSGALEYVADLRRFAAALQARRFAQIILSYCTLEKHPDRKTRASLNWVSHESIFSLLGFFLEHYTLTAVDDVNTNTILVFALKSR